MKWGTVLVWAITLKALWIKTIIGPSLEEIQEIYPSADKEPAKFSSVMDYWPLAEYPYPQVLGKYDLAALKLLYLNRIEIGKDGSDELILDIPAEKSKQEPLTGNTAVLSQKKNYLHCSDNLHNPIMARKTIEMFGMKLPAITFNTLVEDFLCIQRDYGSNPEEIVSSYIDIFKRHFISSIHYYDRTENLSPPSVRLFFIMGFYRKWLHIRNKYLRSAGEEDKTNYDIHNRESLPAYMKLIESGQEGDPEYASFYPVREKAFDFIMDFMFLRTMKCEVASKDGETLFKRMSAGGRPVGSFSLELDLIKRVIRSQYGAELYVEDCESPHIQEFLERNNLKLTGQTGLANFPSYWTEGPKADWQDLNPFSAIFNSLRQYTSLTIQADGIRLDPGPERNQRPVDPISAYILASFMEEPDFFDRFRKKLESRYFDTEMSTAEGLNLYRYKLKAIINMNRTFQTPSEKEILRNNINYFASQWYPIGTNHNSFQRSVLDHLKADGKIEDVNVPFLVSAYEDYLETGEEGVQGFQSYLIQREDVMDLSNTERGFFVPYIDGNLSDRMIVRYNQNLKKMEEIVSSARDEGRDMEELEDILFKKLETQNVFLQQLL